MSERWVCKRCFADNEETDSACVRCGLLRGAEATESDQATWGSQPGTASQLDEIFLEICEPAFTAYVGEPYATSVFYGSMITPSDASWSDGDRAFVCLLYDPEQPQLTESLRAAAR